MTGTDGRATAVYTAPPPPPPAAGAAVDRRGDRGDPDRQRLRRPRIQQIASNPARAAWRHSAAGRTRRRPSSRSRRPGERQHRRRSSTRPAAAARPSIGRRCLPALQRRRIDHELRLDLRRRRERTGQDRRRTRSRRTPAIVQRHADGDQRSRPAGVDDADRDVDASTAPSGDFVISPTSPVVGDTVLFNADSVQAAAGHTLVQYSWDFGDGSPAATRVDFQATHAYTAVGTYNVSLTVIDDAGQHKTFAEDGDGRHRASRQRRSRSPSHRRVNASTSTGAARSRPARRSLRRTHGRGATARRRSAAASVASYDRQRLVRQVTLTVTDSLGRVGSVSQTVTVP